jgi:hypothetical protein
LPVAIRLGGIQVKYHDPLATANGSVSGGAARSVNDKMKNLGILSLTEVVYCLIQKEQKRSNLKQNLCGGLMIRRLGSQS